MSDEFESIEEVDETVQQLADLLREDQSDLAVAIDTILEVKEMVSQIVSAIIHNA